MKYVFIPVCFAVLLFSGIVLPSGEAAAGTHQSVPGYEAYKSLNDFWLVDEEGQSGSGISEEEYRKMHKRGDQMPPEYRDEARQHAEDMKAKKRALKKELESLPPEERKARMEELRHEFDEHHAERSEAFREKFQERWDSASPDERAEFCANAHERCADGGTRACAFAKKSCSQ